MVRHVHRALLERGHVSQVLTSGRMQATGGVVPIAASDLGYTMKSAASAGTAAGFDVISNHHGNGLGILAAVRLRGIRTPIVTTFHNDFAQDRRSHDPYTLEGREFGREPRNWINRFVRYPVLALLDRLARRLSDRTVYVCEANRSSIQGACPRPPARVIYYGLPDRSGAPPGESLEPAELLFVGSYNHRKRPFVLPFLLRRVRRQFPEARLRIVGFRLEEHPALAALFDEVCGRQGVTCVGHVPEESMVHYYRASRVLVLASASEGLPLVILEAQQHGLPCVVTDVNGNREAVEPGRNGHLVPRDDPGELARRCLEILEDPAKEKQMGREARATYEGRFRLERHVEAYLALFEEVIREIGGNP